MHCPAKMDFFPRFSSLCVVWKSLLLSRVHTFMCFLTMYIVLHRITRPVEYTTAVPELYKNFWFSSNFPIYFWTVWIPKPDGRIAIDQNVSERYQSNIYPRSLARIIGSTHVVPTHNSSSNNFDLFPHYYMTWIFSSCHIWLITWIGFLFVFFLFFPAYY